MPKRKVSLNARCPCDSGKKYKNCCITKRFTWLVDENGTFYRSMKMHPKVKKALQEQERRFVDTFGRKPRGDDLFLFDLPSPTEVEERMVEVMIKAGIRPELIYATSRRVVLWSPQRIEI